MTLLAAFKVLLYRYTSQEDLVVGTPIANRNRVEIESLIGLLSILWCYVPGFRGTQAFVSCCIGYGRLRSMQQLTKALCAEKPGRYTSYDKQPTRL